MIFSVEYQQFFAIMKKATAEAKANGFTPDQLDNLLENEDWILDNWC